jgi:hypothetical protein
VELSGITGRALATILIALGFYASSIGFFMLTRAWLPLASFSVGIIMWGITLVQYLIYEKRTKGQEVAVLVLAVMGCWVATPALAHSGEVDDSISATVHINPSDDPVSGEPADFIFEFKDKQKKFVVSECGCAVKITQAGHEIYNEPLLSYNSDASKLHARFAFIFPAPGIYQVEVSGTPRGSAQFQPFKLTYDVRVAREASRFPRIGTHLLHVGAGGIFGVVVVGLYIFNYFKKAVPAK